MSPGALQKLIAQKEKEKITCEKIYTDAGAASVVPDESVAEELPAKISAGSGSGDSAEGAEAMFENIQLKTVKKRAAAEGTESDVADKRSRQASVATSSAAKDA